jgi:hypothetical protein
MAKAETALGRGNVCTGPWKMNKIPLMEKKLQTERKADINAQRLGQVQKGTQT